MKRKLHPIRNLITQLGVAGFLLLLATSWANAQILTNTTVTRTTGNTYTSIAATGTSCTGWSNALSTDDNLSTAQPIGFSFSYLGSTYTQFRMSTNGFLTFNVGTTAVGSGTGAYGYANAALSTAAATVNAVAAYYDDLQTASNAGTLADLSASMKYQTTGTPGNQVCTIEWINMQDFSSTSTSSFNWQVRLYEATGVIEFNYGTFVLANTATLPAQSYSVGINAPTVSATPTPAELLTQQVANTANFSNTPSSNLGGTTDFPANGSRITFTPPPACTGAPSAQPSAIVFSSITNQLITVGFTNASPVPSRYLVVRYPSGSTPTAPVDGTSYTTGQALGVGTVAAVTSATSVVASGLAPGVTYDFYIYSLSVCATGPQYNTVSPLTGTQATLPPGNVLTTATGGLWSATTTWVGGSLPTAFDTVVVATGATLTIDIAANISKVQLNNGSTVFMNNTLVDSTDLVIGTGAVFNGFFGTTGRQLTVRRNIVNSGTLNMAMPGGILLLNGTVAQTISGTGTFGIIPTLTVNNLVGVSVNSNITIGAVLNLTNGVVGGTAAMTLGNATYSPTFNMTSTGGRLSCNATSGLAGILPGNATFTYNAPTPIGSVTTGNELNIAAAANLNVTFNAIAGGNYILGTNISVNNLSLSDTLDVGSNTLTLNGVGTFGAPHVVTGAGTFTMGANATIATAHLLGITSAAAAGSIQTAVRNYSATGNYTYNGAAGQVTGDGLPATLTGGTVTFSTTSGTLLSQFTTFTNITLTSNLLIGSNSVTVNGIANIGTLAITGAGTFTSGPTSRLLLNSTATAGALQTAPNLGNIQNTGGRTYTAGTDIVLGGSVVATGDNFPTTGIDSLVLNQTTAVVLSAPVSVNTLQITNTGRLTTTAVNSLTVLGTQSGSVSRISTGYVDGPLTRTIGVGATGNFTFPLGIGTTGNLGLEIINPVVTGSSVTLTAVARSLATGGTTGTGLTALTNTRYWAIAPVSGGTLTSVGNIRIFESTAATLGGTSKKIGFATGTPLGVFNSIGGQLDSLNVNILSSLTIPSFGTVSDSTFLVLGNGTSAGTFTGGTFSVGPTGTYRSLTAAIAAINESVALSAPVILEFQATYNPSVEAFPIVFRATLPTTQTNSITIRPSAAVSSVINFAASIFTSTSLIDFNGGRNIIIDGRPGGTGTNRFLSFTQQNIGAFPTFRFINEAQNDTLRFLTVAGQNTSTGSALIVIGTTTGTTGNNNIGINNCTINGLSNTANCILGSGSTTPADNKNVNISNNNIFDFFVNGSSPTGIIAGAGSSAWTIASNNFYQTAIRNSYSVPAMNIATNFRALQLNTTAINAVFTVTNNRVGGNIPGIPGSVFILGDSISNLGHLFRPFDFSNAGSTASPTSVQGNTISDITLYTNGADQFTGIGALQTGAYAIGTVTPNVVGSATVNGSITIFHRGSGAGVARGYQFTATGGGTFQNNIVGGINLIVQGAQASGGSITFRGIEASATFIAPLTVSGNTVGSTTLANSIQGLASSLGATGIQAIMMNGASGAAITVSGNTVSNLSVFNQAFAAANSIKGIHVTGTSSISTTVSGNTIRTFRMDAPNNTLGDNSPVVGIVISSSGAGSQFVTNNTINSLSTAFNGPVGNVAMGIFYNSTNSGGASRVERNVIHSLETGATNNLTLQSGINIGASATTLQVFNNFIRLGVNIDGTTNNANATFYGIFKQNTTNTSIIHNTVYIGGSPSATDTSALTAAFYRLNSSPIDTVMNNIFVNARTNASGFGEHYAAYVSNVTGLRGDANMYRASGTGGIVWRVGLSRLTSMQSWRALQKPFEQGSTIGNPSFNAGITNSAATINFTLAAATPAARAALPLSYITLDQGGNTRSATPAIGSYDVGLSALTAATDIYNPVVRITALGNRAAANTTINGVVVTDIGMGVPTSGATAPRLFYRNATTASVWASVAPTSFTGTGNNATFVYNFNWTLIGGTPSVNDRIRYYFVAADAATVPNIWYSNYSSTDPIHSSVGTQTTAPLAADSFLIVTPLPSTINIPVDYPNLTGTTGLFNAINNAALAGNTTVTITADVNETGVNELRQDGLSGFRLTIQPDATLRTLWGNTTTSMIRLNGASNVVFDGGAGKNLRLLDSIGATTSSTVGSTIEFLGGCTNDTVVNCIIEGNGTSTSRGTVLLGAGANTNIVLANNDIRPANNDTLRRHAIGIFSNNTNNNGIIIGGTTARPGGNNISDFTTSAISLAGVGNGTIIGNATVSSNGNNIFNRANSAGLTALSFPSGNNHIVSNNKVYRTGGVYTSAFVALAMTGTTTFGHTISNNSIGGSAPDRSGIATTITTGGSNIVNLSLALTAVTNVTGNNISNIAITTTTNGNALNVVNISGGLINFAGNTIGGSQPYDTLINAGDNGTLQVSGGTVTIDNNTVSNVKYSLNSNYRTAGIYITGGVCTVTNNTVRNLISNTTETATSFPIVGIFATAGTNNVYRGNTIFGIQNNNTGTTQLYQSYGMIITGGTGNIVERNRIYGITTAGLGTGTNSGIVNGIFNNNGSNTVFANNQISVGSNIGETRVNGIVDASTVTNDYIFNTIFVNGATQAGANNSYGFLRSSTANLNLRNNIIYNKRTTTGTGKNFAVGTASAAGITSANINYNLLVVNDTNAIVEMPTGTSNGWANLGTLFTTTYNTNWAERTANIPAEQLFVDTAVSNLGIVTTSPAAWYANGKGIRVIGQTGDFSNASGVRSATIAAGPVDIGSVEFTPTSTPPLAFADKAPANNDSTQYFFGSRMIAKANWGSSGIVPANMDVAYYSGVNPSNTFANSTFMRAYWLLTQSGGTGYTYQLTLMHDSAVLGTVASPSNLGIARYLGTATNWTRFNPTVSNIITGFMNTNTGSVSAVGVFTGTDVTNTPLPVKLTSFSAAVESKDVVVTWVTASEDNNKGFEVERSVDGKTFGFVGFVDGSVNSSVATKYSLLDAAAFANAKADVLYYRLKQVDFDGNSSYSNTVMVSINAEASNGLSVYPNPFDDSYTVSLTANNAGTANIELFDIQGKMVNKQTKELTKGFNTVQMDNLVNLHTGIYFVKVTIDGETQVMKVVKN